MKSNAAPAIESTGRTDTRQTSLTSFGFAPASQLRIDEPGGESHAHAEADIEAAAGPAGKTQEADR